MHDETVEQRILDLEGKVSVLKDTVVNLTQRLRALEIDVGRVRAEAAAG